MERVRLSVSPEVVYDPASDRPDELLTSLEQIIGAWIPLARSGLVKAFSVDSLASILRK
jgi:hypothetical protein